MIQTYKMIFWLQAKTRTVDEVSQILLDIYHCLGRYDEDILPRYRTAKRKKDVSTIDISKVGFIKIITDIVSKLHTPEDVYTLGFFSDLQETSSVGLNCTFGNLPTQRCNAITIQFPPNFSGLTKRMDHLYLLFQDLTETLQPYFSCIKNNLNNHIADTLWKEKPTYVHWINFYSNETIKKIGIKKLEKIAQIERKPYGVYLRICYEPLDIDNCEHLHIQRYITEELGLCCK